MKNLDLSPGSKTGGLQERLEGFTDFDTVITAFEDTLKKAQHIC